MSNNNDLSVGELIRKTRKNKGWTLRDLEEKTEISYSHLGKIERGAYQPSKDSLESIAIALELDKDTLISLAGYPDDMYKGIARQIMIERFGGGETLRENVSKKNFNNYHTGKPIDAKEVLNFGAELVSKYLQTQRDRQDAPRDSDNSKRWNSFIKEMDRKDIDPDKALKMIRNYEKIKKLTED